MISLCEIKQKRAKATVIVNIWVKRKPKAYDLYHSGLMASIKPVGSPCVFNHQRAAPERLTVTLGTLPTKSPIAARLEPYVQLPHFALTFEKAILPAQVDSLKSFGKHVH